MKERELNMKMILLEWMVIPIVYLVFMLICVVGMLGIVLRLMISEAWAWIRWCILR